MTGLLEFLLNQLFITKPPSPWDHPLRNPTSSEVTSQPPCRSCHSIARLTILRQWSPHDWTASDDRVRGGASHSYLDCDPSSNTARFHGHLDIHALGGAGFASQRTTGDRTWDLTGNDGLELDIRQSDGKKYTITLKDTILPKRPDGREQSTISWEYDFCATDKGPFVIQWKDFRPTYRGKDKEDAPPLDRSSIKRISFMMRR